MELDILLMTFISQAVVSGQRESWVIDECKEHDKLNQEPGHRHDDITYDSIAKAFGLKLELYEKAYERMKELSKPKEGQPPFDWDKKSDALSAKLRMIELPKDKSRKDEEQYIFPCENLWVPVAVVNGNVHILPGVPTLCMHPDHS